MNVKEAVKLAVNYTSDLFCDEDITNVGLEEIELHNDEGEWAVTIGFSRPWDSPQNALVALVNQNRIQPRTYKTVVINNNNGEVIAIRNRDVAA